MSNTLKGFICPPGIKKLPDHILLAEKKDIVNIMQVKLTYVKYIKWKLNLLRKLLVERVETQDVHDEYNPSAQTRVNFTATCINHCEDILKDINELDDNS